MGANEKLNHWQDSDEVQPLFPLPEITAHSLAVTTSTAGLPARSATREDATAEARLHGRTRLRKRRKVAARTATWNQTVELVVAVAAAETGGAVGQRKRTMSAEALLLSMLCGLAIRCQRWRCNTGCRSRTLRVPMVFRAWAHTRRCSCAKSCASQCL